MVDHNLIQTLINQFQKRNSKFEKLIEYRHNFISYNFIIYKLLESHGYKDFDGKIYLPIMRNTMKRNEHIYDIIK